MQYGTFLSCKKHSISSLERHSSGRMILSRTGGIPVSPRSDVPLNRWNKKVSQLSFLLWAMAILPFLLPSALANAA